MSLYVDIDVINLYTHITTPQDAEMMMEDGKKEIEGLFVLRQKRGKQEQK